MSNSKVHFLGIGGSGASAAANIAKHQGFIVSGCDTNPHNEFTKNFNQNELYEGTSPDHLEEIDVLAVTPAVFSQDPDNLEIKEAKNRRIKVMTWQEFMGEYLEKDKFVIAVCGTHGKSTTTAMIGQILETAGLDPTVELGAVVEGWGQNYRVGNSKYFVTEADEFNDNFLVSHPDITVVTNIEMDHPEYFKDFEAYQNSFYKFFLQTKQSILGNLESPVVADLLKDVMKESKVACFDFTKNVLNFPLQVIGDFNKSNAQAAFGVGILLGIAPQVIGISLMNYKGIGRRFERMGEYKGAEIFSDFAHHPTEIKVTADAIRQKYPDKKIWLIFQPHMFTRTKFLFDEFVKAFQDLKIDQTTITDIYKSREKDTGEISSKQLVEKIGSKNTDYIPLDQIENEVATKIGNFDLVVFMGAGPIDQIGKKLINE